MKLALKNTLYNLMVFLDKNYESLGDPRVRDKLFLSYCEDHDLSRAGPLIRQYYSHFQTRSQMPDETVQERVQRTQLGKLGLWLKQQGLADLHLEQPHPTRRTRRRRDRDSDDSFEPEDDASEVVESRPNARRRNHPSSSPPRP